MGGKIQSEDKGTKPVPIDLTGTCAKGTEEKIHRSVGVWEKGNKTVLINTISTRPIQKVVMGSTYAADSHKENNVWEK